MRLNDVGHVGELSAAWNSPSAEGQLSRLSRSEKRLLAAIAILSDMADPERTARGSVAPTETADVAEAIARLGERRYTWPDLCELAGVEHPVADRLWRALGFPDVPPDIRAYTDDDLRALKVATEGLEQLSGVEHASAVELLVREARGVSGHLGRIVEIQVEALGELGRLGLRQVALAQAFERGIEKSDLGWVLFYGLRRRLDEALRRRATTDDARRPILAVGFVDLSGFTETAGRLREEELGEMLARFESLVWDVVTEAGGQVVKLIGDEAMLVCPSADAAAQATLEIIAATAKNDLPSARAGLALGPLLARAGDYFGPAVNLAARLVDRADNGAVIVDERVKETLRDGLAFEPLELEALKGIGVVAAWRIRAP